MHRSFAFTVTALVTGALLTSPSGASAAGETCQGRPATIVGTGPDVVGTPGDDVIVTGTSRVVKAGAGNDLICVSPSGLVMLDAGPGDDGVDASGSTAAATEAVLGTGLDHYAGSPGNDIVTSVGTDDEVTTGLGRDQVRIGVTGMPTGILGSYEGEDGLKRSDVLIVQSASLALEVTLDGSILVDGVPAASVTGFRHAHVAAPRVVLRGNAIKNSISATGCDVRIEGRGGKDYLDTALIFGGPTMPCVRADRRIRMSGGSGNDKVYGGSGELRLSGGGGRDTLTGDNGHDRIMGGRGKDILSGGRGRDVLVGGAGRDRVHGGDGRDTCAAEAERSCER